MPCRITGPFCSTGLPRELRLVGDQKTSLSLTTREGEDRKLKTSMHLGVFNTQCQYKVTVCQAYASPSVSVSSFYVVEPRHLARWEHLRDVDFPVVSDGQMVETLTGQNSLAILMPFEVRASEQPGAVSAPFATRTLFGWTINGALLRGQTGGGAAASVNFVTREQQASSFWKTEGAHLNNWHKGLSVEDQKPLDNMQEFVRRSTITA